VFSSLSLVVLVSWFVAGHASSFPAEKAHANNGTVLLNIDQAGVPPPENLFLFSRRRRTSSCEKQTGGSCHFVGCGASRGPTICVSGSCICQPGYCAHGGKCEVPYTPPPAAPTHWVGRVTIGGERCEKGWHAQWFDGSSSFCRTFCCYHRNRYSHRRTRRSYCRVHEDGVGVLKPCARRVPNLIEETPAFVAPLSLLAAPVADDEVEEEAEELDGIEGLGDASSSIFANKAAASLCISGLASVMFIKVVMPRVTGAGDGAREPLLVVD